MDKKNENLKFAQSASALGAGVLGFGLGAKWGIVATQYSIYIIVIGVILHSVGMYLTQMKSISDPANKMAKILWYSAWLCLILVAILMIYLLY